HPRTILAPNPSAGNTTNLPLLPCTSLTHDPAPGPAAPGLRITNPPRLRNHRRRDIHQIARETLTLVLRIPLRVPLGRRNAKAEGALCPRTNVPCTSSER